MHQQNPSDSMTQIVMSHHRNLMARMSNLQYRLFIILTTVNNKFCTRIFKRFKKFAENIDFTRWNLILELKCQKVKNDHGNFAIRVISNLFSSRRIPIIGMIIRVTDFFSSLFKSDSICFRDSREGYG